MNFNDSDWVEKALIQRGFNAAPLNEARVVIVNTCSVREKPEQKVYATLNRIQFESRNNPDTFVVVAGCVAQQLGTSFFDRFAQVRIVSGTDGLQTLPSAIERIILEPHCTLALTDFSTDYPERELNLTSATAPSMAYVNIMQGCDNFCAYCIVPFTRGRQKSRATKSIVDECQTLLEHGTKEICLLGQNVNAFGQDRTGDGTSFSKLLYEIAKLPKLERLRFMTPHPKDFLQDTIDAFADLEVLCPHIHLPMQAGSDSILKAMKRKYSRQNFLDLVHALQKARPNISFSTDIIVGFPHETEEDFLQTCSLVEEVGFRSSFSFCYSDRPGTSAARMQHKIPQDIQLQRLAQLQLTQEKLEKDWLEKRVGQNTTILLEAKSKKIMQAQENENWWQGRDPHGVTINIPLPHNQGYPGLIVPINITTAKRHTLTGEAIGNI